MCIYVCYATVIRPSDYKRTTTYGNTSGKLRVRFAHVKIAFR